MFEFIWLHTNGTQSLVWYEAYEESSWPGQPPELYLTWDCDDPDFVDKVKADIDVTNTADAEDYVYNRLVQDYYEMQEDSAALFV